MPKLLLLPGMDGTGDLFADLIAALPEAFEPIVVAYPRDEFQSYQALANLVRAHAPTDEPYILLAESFSTPLAILFAAERPPNLHGIILCAGFCTSPMLGWRRTLALWLSHWLFRFKLPSFAAAWFLLGDNPPAALLQSLRSAISWVEPEVMAARMRAVLNCNVSAALARVQAPILYLQATQDRIVHPDSHAAMKLIHPGRTIVIDGPHLLLQREPTLAAKIIADFAQTLTPGTTTHPVAVEST